MARRHRAKSGKLSDAATGALLAVAGSLLIIALLGSYWWLSKTRIVLDDMNCPEIGPRAVHAIIIDRTDPISPQQGQVIRQRLQQYREKASFGLRFDIYTVEGDYRNVLKPILSICSPN